MNHYITMVLVMIVSGLLSTMNMWVDTFDDIRFSLNDAYMILLMTGWMLLFMGLLDKHIYAIVGGFACVVLMLVCIRTQFLISSSQYAIGMIPHHSMAIHMSRAVLKKDPVLDVFAEQVIRTQRSEIQILKEYLSKASQMDRP